MADGARDPRIALRIALARPLSLIDGLVPEDRRREARRRGRVGGRPRRDRRRRL